MAQSKKKKSRDHHKEKTPEQMVGDLRNLENSEGWKFVSSQLHNKAADIKEMIWKPSTDQSLKYNVDHLLKERLAVIYICMNLPSESLAIFETIFSADEENRKPIVERLEKIDKKFAADLLRYIKI